ncbi:glycoside hydrolase [Limisphaera ngatamarikiensis]|uniref:Glycoside hydrolase n=1 Tax=Limisphaera ngatamarikiensis TaxID=1324935 RepID=A0A6M1RDY8_9BACT|nr:trehalase family glycosidase [Limisphaera ngatamarikiensis]NGO37806.1 glycoside hydrolase [Limisphaera ngatamarikiensis]
MRNELQGGWRPWLSGVLWACAWGVSVAGTDRLQVLDAEAHRRWVEEFNSGDVETVVNAVPNAVAWGWLRDQIPFFDCPDAAVVRTYYFRWWVYRKHLRWTPTGWVVTEFLPPVSHAGPFNTISCALGHHLAEARWLRDPVYGEDMLRFWLRGHEGGPQPHLHRFSQWLAAAVHDWYCARGDLRAAGAWLDDLMADYEAWERERGRPDGLFWQYDVQDGMEESLSGSRTQRHVRVPLNAYMYGNARAIAEMARRAGRGELAAAYERKAELLRERLLQRLWDPEAQFFKTLREDGRWADVREATGFLPWAFGVVPAGRGYERAWLELTNRSGFWAPAGLTTAERRHPRFRSHGVGRCEWDGAVWPFATSQTLGALARALREDPATPLSLRDWFEAFLIYTRCHERRGRPWIGEYLDEVTGDWIDRGDRSKDYNHSTYADLLITGLVGVVPGAGARLEIRPLLPGSVWDWFCLDGLPYHGRTVTILWDRDGTRYGRGAGFQVWVDGVLMARSESLGTLSCELR